MKHHILYFCIAACLLAGCKGCDDNPNPSGTKPQPTTDGRNTFYCEINGKPYYQKFVGGQMSYPTVIGSYDMNPEYGGVFFRSIYSTKNDKKEVIFSCYKIFSTGSFNVDTTLGSIELMLSDYISCDYSHSYRYNSMNGKMIFSRFDPINGIFSGTFNFKNWLPDYVSGGCDTVRITNGIFDLKL